MHRTLVSVTGAILVWFGFCSSSLAGDPAGDSKWASCLNAPNRDCILDEALWRALLVGPAAARQLGDIAELQAAAGNLEQAQRIAQSIAPEQRERVVALTAIVRARLSRGEALDAGQTLLQAHRVADAMRDRLTRAEALLSIAQAEANAGMAAESSRTLSDGIKQADGVEIRATPKCVLFSAPEDRLDGLFRVAAEQLARAGDIPGSIQAARSIIYKPHIRSEAFRAIGEIVAHAGRQDQAAAILRDAVEAVRASQMPPQHWPSCLHVNVGPASPELYADLLGKIAEAQARIGAAEDVRATLDLALQVIPDIQESAPVKRELSRSQMLSAIAETQRKVGQTSQAEVNLERAAQAASRIENPRRRVMALIRLARAQRGDGRVPDVIGTFNEALAWARAVDKPEERASQLLDVVEAELALGLGSEAGAILSEALAATRSIPEQSRRVDLLSRIARAQDSAGFREDSSSTYLEALAALEATDKVGQRRYSLFMVVRGSQGQPQEKR